MAHYIRLAVDAPTWARWQAALLGLRRYHLIPLNVLQAIPGVPQPPLALAITGERLLLDIGRACSRPDVLDDPSRLFAVVKYALALSTGQPTLALSADFERLDTHKKKVLSDEFGAGMAFTVATALTGASIFLDFETAVAYRLIQTRAPKTRRPDYLAFLGMPDVLILEAKGTQSGDAYATQKQVPDGCDQVSPVRFTPPGAVNVRARMVVATSLHFDNWPPATTAFISDPEGDELEDYSLPENLETTGMQLHYLRVASLTGDSLLVSKLTGRSTVSIEDTIFTRDVAGKRYLGSQITIESGQNLMGVFVGLEQALRDQFIAGDLRGAVRLQDLGSQGLRSLMEGQEILQHDPRALLTIGETAVTLTDGTVWVTWIQ